MKTFTTEGIRYLLNRVYREEISFSHMVEIMNKRVNEEEVREFKDGDFVAGFECIFILHKQIDKDSAQYHVLYVKTNGMLLYNKTYSQLGGINKLRLATEEEKQELLDDLAQEGKRWNEEKLCIENIPVRKFKKGDKVLIKEGVSSKTHYNIDPSFVENMDDLIGKTMTIDRYTYIGDVVCKETEYVFLEDWLEPYEELKKGDLAIFWDSNKEEAFIGKYAYFTRDVPFPHRHHRGTAWANAIKFESKEQYERFIKGEI